MNRCKFWGQIRKRGLQIGENHPTSVQPILKQNQQVRRITFLSPSQSLLHGIQGMSGRLKIFRGVEGRFF